MRRTRCAEGKKDSSASLSKRQRSGFVADGSAFDVSAYVCDDKFANYFSQLKQVFLYITDRCNIACAQCIYKPSVNHSIREEIPLSEAVGLLKAFRRLGASKLTILGGEPTLYGYREEGKPLLSLIHAARAIGFKYIRLDTNGISIRHLLEDPGFAVIDELAFSIDGFNSELNDRLRGKGTFEAAIKSLKSALEIGYNTTITCCAHDKLLRRDPNSNVYLIEQMIKFAEQLGVTTINFHDLFKTGVPMDTWTGDFSPKPADWVAMYNEVSEKIRRREFAIGIRLPQCFVSRCEFDKNPNYYGFCPVKLGERVMVHSDGSIRICSNLICTAFRSGRYESGHIAWEDTHSNETAGHQLEEKTPCTNRSRHRSYGDLVPLCFSFKPGQSEYVWRAVLGWDARIKSREL